MHNVKKMNPFAILDKCPMGAKIIAGCKKNTQLLVIDLPSKSYLID